MDPFELFKSIYQQLTSGSIPLTIAIIVILCIILYFISRILLAGGLTYIGRDLPPLVMLTQNCLNRINDANDTLTMMMNELGAVRERTVKEVQQHINQVLAVQDQLNRDLSAHMQDLDRKRSTLLRELEKVDAAIKALKMEEIKRALEIAGKDREVRINDVKKELNDLAKDVGVLHGLIIGMNTTRKPPLK